MEHKKFNGDRLKNARIFNGISLTDLAAKTQITKQSISLYENGKNVPTYEKVSALSRELGFPYEYFFQENKMNAYTETTYFRSQASATKKDRAAQSIKLEFVAQMYEVLWKYIEFPVFEDPQIEYQGFDDPMASQTAEAIDEIENVVINIRKRWGVADGPIKDLQYLLEQNGVLVTGFNVDKREIDAFSQRTIVDKNDVYLIAVSLGDTSECRARFDMAHELGHILLHPWSEDIESLTKEEFKNRETQANMFASALLLPRDSFVSDISQFPTDIQYYLFMKKKWKVSIQAMMRRARQLDVISQNQYQYLMRQVSKNGWRLREPDDVPATLNESLFQGAIDLLFDNNVLTPKGLLDEFSENGVTLYPNMIEELLHLRKGTLQDEEKKVSLFQIKNN